MAYRVLTIRWVSDEHSSQWEWRPPYASDPHLIRLVEARGPAVSLLETSQAELIGLFTASGWVFARFYATVEPGDPPREARSSAYCLLVSQSDTPLRLPPLSRVAGVLSGVTLLGDAATGPLVPTHLEPAACAVAETTPDVTLASAEALLADGEATVSTVLEAEGIVRLLPPLLARRCAILVNPRCRPSEVDFKIVVTECRQSRELSPESWLRSLRDVYGARSWDEVWNDAAADLSNDSVHGGIGSVESIRALRDADLDLSASRGPGSEFSELQRRRLIRLVRQPERRVEARACRAPLNSDWFSDQAVDLADWAASQFVPSEAWPGPVDTPMGDATLALWTTAVLAGERPGSGGGIRSVLAYLRYPRAKTVWDRLAAGTHPAIPRLNAAAGRWHAQARTGALERIRSRPLGPLTSWILAGGGPP